MHVKEILHRKGHDIKTIGPDQILEHAAAHMKLEGVGALVVRDAKDKLVGMLSEREIVGAVVDYGPRALQMKVSEFMKAAPATCKPGDTVAATAKVMTQRRVRHMPVMEGAKIVGVISVGDIVKERLEEMELERATLRDMALSHR